MDITPYNVASVMIGIGMALALLRLARGPTLLDRVVALELVSMLSIGVILLQVANGASPVLIDVALVLGLVAFLASATLGFYVQRGPGR